MKISCLIPLCCLLFLTSCNEFYGMKNAAIPEKLSCLEHLNENPALINGQYNINHDRDESTPMISVYCDMTGGGWTRIIKDSTTTVSDLAIFGDTTDIADTFYSDPLKGIGWGESVVTGGANADCGFAPKLAMHRLWNYQEIKFVISGDFHAVGGAENSAGYLYISNNLTSHSYIATFLDAWLAEASGSNHLDVGGTVVHDRIQTTGDLIDFAFTIPTPGNQLEVCMSGEAPYDYSKRYIHAMWIK